MTALYGVVDIDLQPDGRAFVQPYSRRVDGLWSMNGLPRVLESLSDARSLGAAVLEAVRLSVGTVLPPLDPKGPPSDRDFLEWVGKRSYAAYAKGVRAVKVHGFYDESGNTLDHMLVTPQANGGARNGFTPITEHRQKLTDLSPEVIGAAIQRAMPFAAV